MDSAHPKCSVLIIQLIFGAILSQCHPAYVVPRPAIGGCMGERAGGCCSRMQRWAATPALTSAKHNSIVALWYLRLILEEICHLGCMRRRGTRLSPALAVPGDVFAYSQASKQPSMRCRLPGAGGCTSTEASLPQRRRPVISTAAGRRTVLTRFFSIPFCSTSRAGERLRKRSTVASCSWRMPQPISRARGFSNFSNATRTAGGRRGSSPSI